MKHVEQFQSVAARSTGDSIAVLASLLVSTTALAQDSEPQSGAKQRDGVTLEEIVVTADRRDSFGAEFV